MRNSRVVLQKDARDLQEHVDQFIQTTDIFAILFNRPPCEETVREKDNLIKEGVQRTIDSTLEMIRRISDPAFGISEDPRLSAKFDVFVDAFTRAFERRKVDVFVSLNFEQKKRAREIIGFHYDSLAELLEINNATNKSIKRGVATYISTSIEPALLELCSKHRLWGFVVELAVHEKFGDRVRAMRDVVVRCFSTEFETATNLYEAMNSPDFPPDDSINDMMRKIREKVEIKTTHMKELIGRFGTKLRENFVTMYRAYLKEKAHREPGSSMAGFSSIVVDVINDRMPNRNDLLTELNSLRQMAHGNREISQLLAKTVSVVERAGESEAD
jgi:hypothetical protein